MRSRIEHDEAGAEVLVREGTGVIDAIEHLAGGLLRVEIHVDTPPGRPRAMRISARPTTQASSAAARAAMRAVESMSRVGFVIEWRRHSWVPVQLPIVNLDLSTDTTATLTELHVATQAELVSVSVVPDTVPTDWMTSQ